MLVDREEQDAIDSTRALRPISMTVISQFPLQGFLPVPISGADGQSQLQVFQL